MARAGDNHKGGNSAGTVGIVCNGQELAHIFGISRQAVTGLQRKGMPAYDDKGPRNAPRYDSAACIKWLESYNQQKINRSTDEDDNLDIEEIRRRRELTGLKKDEISLAVVEERYGDIEAIMESLGKSLAEIRSTLMSIPGLAGQMAFQDTSTIEKLLTEEISRALQELSEYEPETD